VDEGVLEEVLEAVGEEGLRGEEHVEVLQPLGEVVLPSSRFKNNYMAEL
jgi:hypothetical protein